MALSEKNLAVAKVCILTSATDPIVETMDLKWKDECFPIHVSEENFDWAPDFSTDLQNSVVNVDDDEEEMVDFNDSDDDEESADFDADVRDLGVLKDNEAVTGTTVEKSGEHIPVQDEQLSHNDEAVVSTCMGNNIRSPIQTAEQCGLEEVGARGTLGRWDQLIQKGTRMVGFLEGDRFKWMGLMGM